jgi:hypothetical protein
MPPSGIRPHTSSKGAAADLRLRPRSLRDRQIERFAHFRDTVLYYQINTPAQSWRVAYVSFFRSHTLTKVHSLCIMILPELIQFHRNYTTHKSTHKILTVTLPFVVWFCWWCRRLDLSKISAEIFFGQYDMVNAADKSSIQIVILGLMSIQKWTFVQKSLHW